VAAPYRPATATQSRKKTANPKRRSFRSHQRDDQAGDQEAVVEPLVGGQHLGLLRLLLGGAERRPALRPGPQDHLQDDDVDVDQRDERDESGGESGHVVVKQSPGSVGNGGNSSTPWPKTAGDTADEVLASTECPPVPGCR